MVPEVRSIIRRIDEYVTKDEFLKSYDIGKIAIQEFDQSREYDKSIQILEKLIDYAIQNNEITIKETLLAHLIIRCTISGKLESAKKYNLQEDFMVPIAKIVKSLLDIRINQEKYNFVLEGIEKLSIFGEYEQLIHIPFSNFSSDEQAIQFLEDYYPDGRYLINLIDNQTLLHHSINIDVGSPQEVNVVESRRVYRITE